MLSQYLTPTTVYKNQSTKLPLRSEAWQMAMLNEKGGKVLRKIFKRMLTLCIMLGLFSSCCLWVEAAKSKVIELKAGNTYQYDLNGDGKKEKIKFTRNTVGYTEDYLPRTHYKIYVNKKVMLDQKTSKKDWWAEVEEEPTVYIIDLNSKDKYKEIYIHFDAYGGAYKATLYRYNGKKLKQIAYKFDTNVPGGEFSRLESTQASDGTLTYHGHVGLGGAVWGMWASYKYKISGGTFKLESYTFSVDDGSVTKYKVKKMLPATTSRTGKKKAFILRKGETIRILKIYIGKKVSKNQYFYVKNTAGKKGWIKLDLKATGLELYG